MDITTRQLITNVVLAPSPSGNSNQDALARALEDCAMSMHDRRDYQRAEFLYRWALAVLMESQAPEWRLALCTHQLAELYAEQSMFDRAEPLYLRAIFLWRLSLGEDHYMSGLCLRSYAEALDQQGKTDQANKIRRQAQDIIDAQKCQDGQWRFDP